MTKWEILMQTLGALGGLEAVKWILTRRSSRRMEQAQAIKEEAAAISAREKLYEETILFLQSQLKEKEERFAAQTKLMRETMQSELRLTRDNGRLAAELQLCRCDRKSCPERLPPLHNPEIR